jgi:hypothetical protein
MNGVKNVRSGLFVDEWCVRVNVRFCADQVFAQSGFTLRFLCVFAVRFGSAGGNAVYTTKQGLEARHNKAQIIA